MNQCRAFLNFFDFMVEKLSAQSGTVHIPPEVQEFYDKLSKNETVLDKPEITKNGASILKTLQEIEQKPYTAKALSEIMDVTSRTISGSLRKLVTNGFVDKLGQNPIEYQITAKGLEFTITQEMLNG